MSSITAPGLNCPTSYCPSRIIVLVHKDSTLIQWLGITTAGAGCHGRIWPHERDTNDWGGYLSIYLEYSHYSCTMCTHWGHGSFVHKGSNKSMRAKQTGNMSASSTLRDGDSAMHPNSKTAWLWVCFLQWGDFVGSGVGILSGYVSGGGLPNGRETAISSSFPKNCVQTAFTEPSHPSSMHTRLGIRSSSGRVCMPRCLAKAFQHLLDARSTTSSFQVPNNHAGLLKGIHTIFHETYAIQI